MIRILFSAFLLMLVLPLIAHSQSITADRQARSVLQVSLPLYDKLDLALSGQVQFGHNFSTRVNQRVGGMLQFRVNPYLQLSSGYNHLQILPAPGRYIIEHRFSAGTTVRSMPLWGFTVSDRTMIERRQREEGFSMRYRNRLLIERPVQIGTVAFRPYASAEAFYDGRYKDWSRSQVALGVVMPFTKLVSGDFYYMRQDDSHPRIQRAHVWSTGLRLRP